MEILPERPLAVAKQIRSCARSESVQSPPLLAMRGFTEEQQAVEQCRPASPWKNPLYVAAIRTRSGRLGAGTWRRRRKCRSKLLAGTNLSGVGGRRVCATRKFLS